MPDIKALSLLSEESKRIRGIPKPPGDYGAAAAYRTDNEKVIDQTYNTVAQIQAYVKEINDAMDELRKALKESTKMVQDAIQKALDSIKVGTGVIPLKVITYVRELQKFESKKQRLEEFALKTQGLIDKLSSNIGGTFDDIQLLKGYLDSWKREKDENYEEEQARLAREKQEQEQRDRKRKEEEERKKREEEERRKKEEEERKQREKEEEERRREEERKRREEDEKRKKEEQERRKREAEERRKREEEEERRREEEERRRREEEKKRKEEEEEREREEEERRNREAEERRKREEEEKRRREEEERKRRLEEEARLKEIERQRREAERREKERLRREEEERRRRLDPNNWESLVYDRSDGEVDGRRTHHNGVCCVLSTSSDSVDKDDLECLASDEDTDIIQILDEGEKLASSIIEVESKKGPISLEVPGRIFIPHCHVTDPGDEIVVKVSINGREWVTKSPIKTTPNITEREGVKMVGVEINPLDKVRVVVTARRKNQSFIFNESSSSEQSTYDRNIKLFIPRNTFNRPTEVNLSVRPVTDDTLSTLAREHECCEQILSTSSLMTLSCEKAPAKDIEVDLVKSQRQTGQSSRGKAHQMYRTKENVWRFADAEYKGKGQDVSVSLPAGRNLYHVIEIELPQNVAREDALQAAEVIYDHAMKTVVRLLVRQKQDNPSLVMVHCVRQTDVVARLRDLGALGYTTGADSSRDFCLKDGQKLQISCVGNIGMTEGAEEMFELPFYTYMDSAKREITVQVKDLYKQRDLEEYVGNLHCNVLSLDPKHAGPELDIEMPLTYPKSPRIRTQIKRTKVAFPHYLTALTVFLSWELTERKELDWWTVVSKLDKKQKMMSLYRQAKSKCDEDDSRAICKTVLSDWMKVKPRQDDKVEPICTALQDCGLSDLSSECREFVEYHKTALSTAEMQKIATQVTYSITEVGERLGLSPDVIRKLTAEYQDSASEQMLALLEEWRQSDAAVEKGTDAMVFLRQTLGV